MLPIKNRHLLYVLFLLALSVVCTTALANSKVYTFIAEVASTIEEKLPVSNNAIETETSDRTPNTIRKSQTNTTSTAFMPPSIINGADAEVGCGVDGSSVVQVFLCGDYDTKPLTLQGNPSGAVWERYVPNGGCTLDFDDNCPSFLVAGSGCNNNGASWTQVATGGSYEILPGDVPVASGTEYRVRSGGTTYYIKATKSAFSYSSEVRNVVCGSLGSIRITSLSPAYELRIADDTGVFSDWERTSKEFTDLLVGNYTIEARLKDTPNACEYPYPPFSIVERDLDIQVTVTDAICPGQNGDINVLLNGSEVPGPYTYILIDATTGAEIITHPSQPGFTDSFPDQSPGTYRVKVETPECQDDFSSGTSAPTQSQDVNGDPIVIGEGLQPIVVDANLNGQSFGCDTITSINIDITTTGGTPPYSYTVTGGGSGSSPADYNDTQVSQYPVTSSGTYTFTITDDNGCSPSEPLSVYISDLPPPVIDPAPIPGTCANGGGKIDFQVVSNPGYDLEYKLSEFSTTYYSTSIVPVPDATYSDLWVRYTQGAFTCEIRIADTVVVTSDTTLDGFASVTVPYTCTNGATISFDPSQTDGGSGTGYEYSIDGTNWFTTVDFPGLNPGDYTPYVRDDNNCSRDLPEINIPDSPAPSDITFVQGNIDCSSGTSEVTVTVVGGVGPFTYEIIAPAAAVTGPQGSTVFPNLLLDTRHDFEITDGNGCTHPASFVTGGISTIQVRAKSGGDDKVCDGANDGFGAFIIDGFNPDTPGSDYSYTVVGPGLSLSGNSSDLEIPITGLEEGTYTITVTDSDTNCNDTADFVVSEAPTLTVTPNVTQMSCANGNTGAVQAVKGGGFSGQAQYRLTYPDLTTIIGWKNGRFFGGLNQTGTYTIEVRDSEGCIADDTFNLTSLGAPTITAGVINRCYTGGSLASIEVFSAVGTGDINDHRFRIVGQGLQPFGTAGTHTFTGLVPGTYTIQVENIVTGCDATLAPITIEPELQVQLNLNNEIACGGDGSIAIVVSGGDVSDLTSTSYILRKDGVVVPGHNGVQLPSNPFTYTVPFGEHGDYTIELMDNNSCTDISDPLTLIEPTNITATADPTGPSCGDPNSGFVEIVPDVTPGVAPFQYVFGPVGSLTDVVTDPNYPDGDAGDGVIYTFSSQNIYSGLAIGTYEYIVIDDRGCPTSLQTVTVVDDGDPAPAITVTPIDATCTASGPASGGVTIDFTTAGSPNYRVVIEDNFGNELFVQDNVPPGAFPLTVNDPDLVPGSYQVIVVDARGCNDIQSLTIDTNSLDITPFYPTITTCVAGGYTVCVDISGGSPPSPEDYSIRLVEDPEALWEDPNTDFDTHCFSGLLAGVSYSVEVRDDRTLCTYQEVITLPNGPNLTVTLDVDGATCRNGDVGVNYTIDAGNAGTPPYEIEIRNLDTGTIVYGPITTSDLTLATDLTVPSGRYGVSVLDAADCSGGDEDEAILNAPRVDIVSNQNANCNAPGLLTVRGSGGFLNPGSVYQFAYVSPLPPGSVPALSEFSDATTVQLPGSPAPGTPYDIWIRDDNFCSYRISAAVIQEDPPLPAPIIDVVNQCAATPPSSGYEITITMPGNIDTPTFTLDGVSQTPTYTPGNPTVALFNVPSIGNYPITVTDINGCFVNDSAEVYQVLSATADFTTTPPTCTDADGEIVITTNGGSGDFTFELSGNDYTGTPITNVTQTNNGTFTGIAPGDYQVLVTDNEVRGGGIFCDDTVDNIISEEPVVPQIIDTGATPITCAGDNDGSITLILQPDPDADAVSEYRLYDNGGTLLFTNVPDGSGNISSSFTGLGPDTYRVEVETVRGCIDFENVPIIDPAPFEIEVVDPPTTFQCQPGANQAGSATFTATIVGTNVGTGPSSEYRYRIDSTGSFGTSATFEVFDTGSTQTIVVEAIDAHGCSDTFIFNIDPPTEVSGSITQFAPMNCIQGEIIDVSVSMTIPADYSIRANANSVATFADILKTAPTTDPDVTRITLPQVEGDYYLEIVSGGCVYPIPVYTVLPPELPIVVIAEVTPETCENAADGVISIDITNYTGNDYTYWVYDANDPGFTSGDFTLSSPVVGANGPVTGSIDISALGNPATVPLGIPGGNVRVVVREDSAPNCDGISGVTTVRSPNGQLEVFELRQEQTVGCSNNLGIISFNGRFGWDSNPYDFQVEYGTTITGPWSEIQAFDPNQTISNLASGFYQVTVRDEYLCEVSEILELPSVPLPEVALRIERELECPSGTDAILVAVDPNDMITEGAIGGVAGEQFIYQLIKLDSGHPDPMNQDPSIAANREFEYGQQTSPRFEGSGGIGVIPAGFYSVLIEGPYGCDAYSPVIEVVPPQPINPQLRLVSAPACGTPGALELKVFNAEVDGSGNLLPSVAYEYRPWVDPFLGPNTNTWTTMTDQNGTAVENINGIVGQFYKFEVRKVGAFGNCLERVSNQIEVKDPSVLTIDPTSPQSPPSCSSIDDGRIEIKASGGTGIYEYSLYLADPLAPTVPTTIERPAQVSANFENLPPNYYVAVVTSGDPSVCREEFPFELAPAIAVAITPSAQNVNCFGDETGSITMTVDAGYPGLVEFAIEPNFADLDSDSTNPLVYTFTDLPVKADGTPYRVLAQDAAGCPYFFDVPLTQPDQLQITDIQTTPELCIGANDGTVIFDIQGGTPFNDPMVSTSPYYEYKIEMISPIDETGTGIFAPYDGETIQNLIGGATYEIYIQDVNLCPASDVFTINIGVDLSAEPLVQYGCEGIFPSSTASVVLDNPGLLPDLLFYLEDLNSTDPPLTEQEMIDLADTQYTWGDLPASQYQAHIFHSNGCSIIVELGEILTYEPLTLSMPEKTAPNEITITASGGFGDYEYFFQGESQGADNVYVSNQDMNVEIMVRDSMGCIVTASIPFDFTGMLEIPNFFTPDGDNNNDVWFPKNREFFPNIEVKIYDRYGRVVAILNQIDSWDGTYEGNELPSGDYWYVVNQNDDRKTRYVGHFTLYR